MRLLLWITFVILLGIGLWCTYSLYKHFVEYEEVKKQVREMTIFLCRDVYQCETADGKKFP